RQRHDGDVESALSHEIIYHRTDRLAARNGDHIPIAQRLQQLVCCGSPDILDRRFRTSGDRWGDDRAVEAARLDKALLQVDQALERALHLDLEHAQPSAL